MAILRPLLAETGAEAGRQGRHRHRQGRHPRHRQEPGRDDARGRRLRGHRPRRQHGRRQVPRRARGAQARHPGHVRAAHDHDAVHEGRDPGAQGPRHPRRSTSSSSAARRSTRSSRMAVGADAYCRDAAIAAETARKFVAVTERGRRPDAASATRPPAPTLVIGCGALARELLELVARERAGRRRRRALPARAAPQPPGADRGRGRREADPSCARRLRPHLRGVRATAAPAARSTGCWPSTASSGCRAPTATRPTPASPRSPRSRPRSRARST